MLREMQQLHEKTMNQIGKEEEQTARLSLPGWQQAQLRIVDAYQDRVREIQEAEDQQNAALDADIKAHADHVAMDQQAEVMNEQDANAKKLAACQLMNAQKQQLDLETRDKYASGLKSMFSNPAQFFEQRAMDTAFQLMANEMLSTFKSSSPAGGIMQYLFGMGPEMNTSTNPLNAFSSAIAGTHGASAGSGMVLSNAGTTLISAGNLQITAANALLTSATAL